jgi:hypothetical protein
MVCRAGGAARSFRPRPRLALIAVAPGPFTARSDPGCRGASGPHRRPRGRGGQGPPRRRGRGPSGCTCSEATSRTRSPVHVQPLGPAHLEHAADAPGDVVRRLRVEALDVDHARPELAVLAVLLPESELGELPAGELEDELVGARLEQAGKVRPVAPVKARAAEPLAEADEVGEAGLDPLGPWPASTPTLAAPGAGSGSSRPPASICTLGYPDLKF